MASCISLDPLASLPSPGPALITAPRRSGVAETSGGSHRVLWDPYSNKVSLMDVHYLILIY